MAGGRPREFDADEALDRALRVFWQRGYEGAALSDLTAAMGINRPSLYAAFGNKESLFRKAIERYTDQQATHMRDALLQPTARGVAEHMLRGAADMATRPDCPQGCLGLQGGLAMGEDSESARQQLADWRRTGEIGLRERFERAKAEGDLPEDVDAGDLAKFVAVVSQGISVQAADGVGREQLHRMAEMALRAWPS
ncbi:AcrR family transcriptional regulator [Saccharothrix ecbatanensis]|uniref:AcrR family transcriptional regulator n=1 Tax=Saccharothrix ecbatanensis TaxID=1105145 RepID=A0A7W9HEV6_9PSEU|nr:TetR/AcrR family transcriptional regulator [Saccharothrix ecbatanensis]MBB5800895.1 AcrR family transcriptional regulator [Saccharothrix ecbatanensis]